MYIALTAATASLCAPIINVSTGTVIGITVADDADGDPIRYYIGPGTINANNFDVNETTGEVSLQRELDREVHGMRIRIRLIHTNTSHVIMIITSSFRL